MLNSATGIFLDSTALMRPDFDAALIIMKVLQVYRGYFPEVQGGLPEVIRQVCRSTRQNGVEQRIFTFADETAPLLTVDDVEVHRFKRSFEVASCDVSFHALAGFKQLVEWADIVHYHFPWPFADILHFLGQVKKPSIITYHSDIVRQQSLATFYRPLMHAFLKSASAIVATSDNYAATSPTLQRYTDKLEIIPIGIDQSIYPDVKESDIRRVQDRYGSDYFLFLGVLRYYKGLNYLLEALKDTQLRCIIAGTGPIENELKQRARALSLDNLIFTGYIDESEKCALIESSRAVVFPSHLRSEAFGVTLLEGAMMAKPLISTELGTGTSYVNQDGETGFVIPPADPHELREAMLKLDNDVALAQRMGLAARQRYEALFTGEKMGERYAMLYRKLVAKP